MSSPQAQGFEGFDTPEGQVIELQTPDSPEPIVHHHPHHNAVPSAVCTYSHISISPISTSLRANELGKLMLAVGLPAAVAILALSEKLQGAAVGLMVGCAFIWIGILIRNPLDRLADILELLGSGVVLASLFGLVAASQSKPFCTTILWLSCALCWLPLLLSLFYHVKILIKG